MFLWANTADERLGEAADVILDTSNTLYLSAASSWELAIKYGLGKLPLPEPPRTYVPSRMAAIGAYPLDVSHAHAASVADLPDLHRDPFDRLLVAQAAGEGLILLTGDAALADYPIESIVI